LLHTATRRKNVPLDDDQLAFLERLTTSGTAERAALRELAPEVRKSEASVLSALITLGSKTVREQALNASYSEPDTRRVLDGSSPDIGAGGLHGRDDDE
jgi:hypothetical protein